MNTEELLRLLACPKCLGDLTTLDYNGGTTGFACSACGVVYPVRDDIPVMLVEEAIPRDQWERQQTCNKQDARGGVA